MSGNSFSDDSHQLLQPVQLRPFAFQMMIPCRKLIIKKILNKFLNNNDRRKKEMM